MSGTGPEFVDPDLADRSLAADIRTREEPEDDEDEDDDKNDPDDEDDDGNSDGYSE